MVTDIVIDEVTYDQLADIEIEFEEVEDVIIRKQVELQSPLYHKRHEIVSKIPNFWALVFEQAPPDVDEYIHPSDASALLACLTSFKVTHYEIEGGDSGLAEPRSIAFRFEFKENEYFHDTVIEKKFAFRYGKGGWSGFVSEPVVINWKAGKDLTDGLLTLARKVYEDDVARAASGATKDNKVPTDNEKELVNKLEKTIDGGVSFFAWFGYRGRVVTEEEHKAEKARLAAHRAGVKEQKKSGENDENDDDDGDDDDDDDDEHEFEIFSDGADLAICLADDLYPNAIKYFTQAQELDSLSDLEFETEDEDEEMAE